MPRAPLVVAGVVLVAASCAADWVGFRDGPSNAASVDLGTLRAPSGAWSWRPSEEARSYAGEAGVFSSPALANVDGRAVVFVGCYDHNVYAVDLATGAERWRYSTGAPVYGTPCVAQLPSGPLVLVGSGDRTFYALDGRDGTKVWAHQLVQWRASVGRALLASPALFEHDGKPAVLLCAWVYDRSAASPLEEASALAYEAATGRLLWRLPLGTSALASPAAFRQAGGWRAMVGGGDGKVWALDLDQGKVLWRIVLRGEVVATAAIAEVGRGSGPSSMALIGSRYGELHALDALTGRTLWSFRAQRAIDSSPAVAEVDGALTAFFGSHDQSLYAVSAQTGDLLWRFHTKGDVYSSPAVFHSGERPLIAFTSGDDRLYVLDARTGSEVWSTSPGRYLWGYRIVGDSLWSSPVVAHLSGTDLLVLPFYDGELHVYPLTATVEEPRGDPGYGKQMIARTLLAMGGTLILCVWLTRRRSRQALQ